MLTIEDALRSDLLQAGQETLANQMERMIAEEDAPLVSALRRSERDPFLEPLLFAHFTSRDSQTPLKQLLFGYLDPSSRPAQLEVMADLEGRVCLPGLGDYVCEPSHGQGLQLVRRGQSEHQLVSENQPISSNFEPVVNVPGTPVEVSRAHHPLLDRYFVARSASDSRGVVSTPEVVGPAFLNSIRSALDIVGANFPDYYEAILSVTRRLFVFRAERGNSFAAVSAHGIAFLRVEGDPSVVFFIEDLLHQCGHIILSAMTLDGEAFLRIDPDAPLSLLTRDPKETRSIYVTLHGVFTESLMTSCLDQCLEQGVFTGTLRHELMGRLAYILLRFAIDLPSISRPEIFTQSGLQLVEAARRILADTYERRSDSLRQIDLSNQPYTFSYKRFAERNALQT